MQREEKTKEDLKIMINDNFKKSMAANDIVLMSSNERSRIQTDVIGQWRFVVKCYLENQRQFRLLFRKREEMKLSKRCGKSIT